MGVGSTEFKFKPANAIDLGNEDDGDDPYAALVAGKSTKSKAKAKNDAATLKQEAAKRKLEEEAKLPTKGNPSDFFIMDWVPGDTNDVTGQGRVPTEEQKIFIFTHYPNCAQLQMMIAKVYELYYFAVGKEQKEQEKERNKNNYNKAPGYRQNNNSGGEE